MSFFDYHGKAVYTGPESSGKTAMLSKQLKVSLKNSVKWKKKYGFVRPIVGNLSFSDKFRETCERKGVPVLDWHDIDQLSSLRGCDLFIDELGVYFDSRLFKDMPVSVRRWLPQSEKLGVRIFGAAQDYGQIDKNYRRLVQRLYEVKKYSGTTRPGLHPELIALCQTCSRHKPTAQPQR